MRRAALLVLLLLLIAGTAGATVRILPLGDSMTKGSTQTPAEASHPTYRYWLWQQLQGRDVDFVGSWTAPNFAYDFDQDNEGHGGYMTGGILYGAADDPGQGKLSVWLTRYQFDVALVMLGTNDVLNGITTAESARNLEGIIAQLRARNPNAVILLAKIPPTSLPRPGIEALNAAIPGVAARTSTLQSPVVVVDMYTGYDGVADNQAPLGIHPDESGEKRIAARWYAALQPYLGAGPTPSATPSPTPTPTPSPTPTPTATSVPVTPGAAAPNVIRSPGAVVYAGESGLDVTAAGIGAGDTLGWFAGAPNTGATPDATLRIVDPKRAAIPHDARTGAWYDLDRGRALALNVEEPALSLRLIDTETGRYVPGGEVAKGRRFDLEVSSSLSAFAARGTGAPVAVRIRDPAGRTVSTLVGDGGARISLDRLMITTTPYVVRGTNGPAWNTGDGAYGAGAYELWAEGLFDHEHGTASPDPSGAVGTQVSAPVRLAVAAAPTTAPVTSVPATSVPATSAPSTAVTTAPPATVTAPPTVATATATTVPPAATTVAPTPPSGNTSWWFQYFLGGLAVLLLLAGVGVWWALRTPGPSDSAKPRPKKSGGPPSTPRANRGSRPALQIALDRVRAWDPARGRVSTLEAALRELEHGEQVRTGRKAVDLLALVPPARIPSRPMPEPVRRWGTRVGFVPLSIDRYGDVLFYSPTPHQGGTRLVVKRADELLDRLGPDGELRR